jgi:hypothetical protein
VELKNICWSAWPGSRPALTPLLRLVNEAPPQTVSAMECAGSGPLRIEY